MSLWSKLVALFKPAVQPSGLKAASTWTPESVEAAIEAAGRAEVFEEARRIGWTCANPPLYVWGIIASEVMARKRPASTTLH